MLRLLSDEHFPEKVILGILRRDPGVDIVRLHDVGLRTRPDEEILAWAAEENRVLVTHDRRTIPRHVKIRIAAGLPVVGAIIVARKMRIRQAIEEILIAAHCGDPAQWLDRLLYLPL